MHNIKSEWFKVVINRNFFFPFTLTKVFCTGNVLGVEFISDECSLPCIRSITTKTYILGSYMSYVCRFPIELFTTSAKGHCTDSAKYFCLENDLINEYSENCTVPDFLMPGK